MPETKRCTCIKPIVINGQRLSIGEQIDLVENQYRPLQNGDFITLDDAAGELIRALIQEDEAPEIVIEDVQAEENTTEVVSASVSRQTPSTPNTQAVGYEVGD